MTGSKTETTEDRLIKRLEKLILSGNISSAEFVAMELETIYNRKLKDIDSGSAENASKARKAELIVKIGDVQRIMRNYDRAIKLYDEALSISKDGRTAVDAYLSICEVFKERGDWDASLQACESGKAVADRIGDREGVADCERGIAYIHWRHGNFHKSLEVYRRSIAHLPDGSDSMLKARIHMETGNVYSEMHEYAKAKAEYDVAMPIVEASTDRYQQIRIYNNLGYLLTKLEDWPGAMKMYEKEIRMAKRIGDRKWEGWGYFNMSECLSKTGEPNKALEYSDRSKAALESAKDNIGIMKTYISYGYAYGELGDLNKVKENFDVAIRMAEKNKMGSIIAYYNLEYAHTLAKVDKDLALKQAKKALGIYKELDAPRYAEECLELIHSLQKKT